MTQEESEWCEELWMRYHLASGGPEKIRWRNKLILVCLPTVKAIARTRDTANLAGDRGDLVQAGVFGVIEAIKTYEPTIAAFSTYASRKIRWAMGDWSRGHRIDRGNRSQCRMLSLDTASEDADTGLMLRLADMLAAESAQPVSAQMQADEFWASMLKGLSPLDRLILTLYCRCDLTLRQIGQYLDLSEGRICKRRSEALAWLCDARADLARSRKATHTQRSRRNC